MPTLERATDALFTPLRRADSRRRVALIVVGTLAWALALLVLMVVLRRLDAVETALLITTVSLLVAFVLLVVGRARRVRRWRTP